MQNGDLLLGFASWEDRFQLGMYRDLDRVGIRQVLVFYFGSYAERTQEDRDRLDRKCAALGIQCDSCILEVDSPATNWQKVVRRIEEAVRECDRVIVDISTMPREIIWYIFWYVAQSGIEGHYIYHTPNDYGPNWLSRDARSPRLVYKLSGLSLPSNGTVVLVTLGYDIQRARRLFNWYEPKEIIVGIQRDSQFNRNRELMESQQKLLEDEYGCSVFQLDAFSDDRGEEAIRRVLSEVADDRNILMSSLGPKLTSVSLFNIQQIDSRCGLVYTPSNEFSEDYSSGIGKSYFGKIVGVR